MMSAHLLLILAAVSEVIPVRTQAEFDAFPEKFAYALAEGRRRGPHFLL